MRCISFMPATAYRRSADAAAAKTGATTFDGVSTIPAWPLSLPMSLAAQSAGGTPTDTREPQPFLAIRLICRFKTPDVLNYVSRLQERRYYNDCANALTWLRNGGNVREYP